jgi:hypothetical protein
VCSLDSADEDPAPSKAGVFSTKGLRVMTERTTLLLRHIGGAHYEVDEISTGRLSYEEIPRDSNWLFADLKAALDHLGWNVEDDQDAGAQRCLFLKRDRPAPETVREWFQVSTQRRVHRSRTSVTGRAVQQAEAFPGGMIHASDGTRTACGRGLQAAHRLARPSVDCPPPRDLPGLQPTHGSPRLKQRPGYRPRRKIMSHLRRGGSGRPCA